MVDYKEDLETVVDKLYDFVEAAGKVTVKEAALALSITEEQTEKLALILEESDLIEIQYTLSGSILMPKKTAAEKPMIPYATSKQAPKESEALEDVKSVENVAEFIEKDFVEKLSKAEKSLQSLSSKKDLSPRDIEALRKELAFLQERLKNFESSVRKIQTGEVSFEQQLEKYSVQLTDLEKLRIEEEKKVKPSPQMANLLAFLIAWLHALIESLKLGKKQGQNAESGAKSKAPHLQTSAEAKKTLQAPASAGAGEEKTPAMKLPSVHLLDELKLPEIGFGVPSSQPQKKEKPEKATPAKKGGKARVKAIRARKPSQRKHPKQAKAAKHARPSKLSKSAKRRTAGRRKNRNGRK